MTLSQGSLQGGLTQLGFLNFQRERKEQQLNFVEAFGTKLTKQKSIKCGNLLASWKDFLKKEA